MCVYESMEISWNEIEFDKRVEKQMTQAMHPETGFFLIAIYLHINIFVSK